MDFSEILRVEAKSSHAQFHEYALTVGKASPNTFFLFFEGEDDPIFYLSFILERLSERPYFEFVCHGRSEVIKVHDLVSRDGRATGRALFFIDKDHTDILEGPSNLPATIYQTSTYSFENILVCETIFRRYWVERLRLKITDPRYDQWLTRFNVAHRDFMRHSRILMGAILIGRGINGEQPVKLNLNNVNLDKVFLVKAEDGRTRWRVGASVSFIAAVDLAGSDFKPKLRRVCRHYLIGNAKAYVRGKFEIWFLVKFLQQMTHLLSDRAACNAAGVPRARPIQALSYPNYLAIVAALAPYPTDLRLFLEQSIPR